VVSAGDGVRREEVDEVRGAEAGVRHAVEDHGNRVLGLGDGANLGGDGSVGAASQEAEAGSTRAVGDTDGAGELDKIASSEAREFARGQERRESVDGVIDSEVGGEVGLDGVEDNHGTVSTSSGELAALGETDRIVESQTKGLVHIFAANSAEELILEGISEVKEDAAGLVGRSVLGVGASNTLEVGSGDDCGEGDKDGGEFEDHG